MKNDINEKLEKLNIKLDEATVPAGSYVPFVISNNLVFISGQLPFTNGQLTVKGKIGDNVSVEEGIKMAEACAKALLSQLKLACKGNLNGASDLFVKIFGERGKHSRFAIGASSLPLNVPVEIEGIFEIENWTIFS